MDKRPIGIFDSGVGGLTVVDKVRKLLPNEKIIYFGDTARVPYGNKSKETVTRFAGEIARFLLGLKVKLIIVACNTASSLSLGALKRALPVTVIGVIKPGAEEAVTKTRNNRIGVIGTDATVSSGTYKKEIRNLRKNIRVFQRSCPLFVPLAENGWINDNITLKIAERYLKPLVKERIDTLILGCTHYPILKGAIKKVAGKRIKIIDSSDAVAVYAKKVLSEKKLAAPPGKGGAVFFASDDTKGFGKTARLFLGRKIKAKKAAL